MKSKKLVSFESNAELKTGDLVVPEKFSWRQFGWEMPYRFRQGSVPGIHKFGNGSWLRHYRCHQKIRELFGPREEGIPPTRKGALRIEGCSPDPWSHDMPRSRQKCWKEQRKTQHKNGK